jgi:type IV pilus assembly protein PilV
MHQSTGAHQRRHSRMQVNMTKMPEKIFMRKNHQSGFTLLEVLIALLILSIGLLGLAALQTTGLRSNQMASMRTLATQTAYDITDRMRANEMSTGITREPATGKITYNSANDDYLIAFDASDPTATVDCATAECTHQELALYDLAQWRAAVALLPGGKSEIVCQDEAGAACADGDVDFPNEINHVITVYWNEARSKTAVNHNCPPVDDTDLRCFRLSYTE